MSFTIDIDHTNKLIRYQHGGEINKGNIGEAWNQFLQLKEFTDLKYNLLSDYSDAKFLMNYKEINEISGFLSRIKEILEGKKQAIVLLEPVSTALSMLLEGEVNKQIGFIVKVFSTKKAAIQWLTE